MTEEMCAFGTKEKSNQKDEVSLSKDFNYTSYDGPFKNVFGIKRILAVVIRETIALYQNCSVDEVVDLIESTAAEMKKPVNANDKITSNESYVDGEGTVQYDIIVKVGVPAYQINEMGHEYVQIRLNLEMQRDSTPGYPLTYRGLYYGSRLISDQLPKINKDTDYGILVPVYSIWITLVGENTDAANKVLRYQLCNTSGFMVQKTNSFIGRMDAVTGLLHMYLICIDKTILKSKDVKEGLDSVVEFISLLFAGKFNDSRMKAHDIKFRGVVDKHGKELENMAGYYSEVEDMVRAERAIGEAAGKAIGEATGKAIGIIEMAVEYHEDKNITIKRLAGKLDLTLKEAEEIYDKYSN